MSSYRDKRSSLPRTPAPKRITAPASSRLASILSSSHERNTSEPDASPPPVPPQNPARNTTRAANDAAPTSPLRNTTNTSSPRRARATSNRGRHNFVAGALGESPREDEENEKASPPPPYTATDSTPTTTSTDNSSTNWPLTAQTNTLPTGGSPRSPSGNAWASSPYLVAPKPTLQQHPAHRRDSLLMRSPGFMGRRGGMWRLLLFVIAATMMMAMALGLGLGLTIGRRKHQSSAASDAGPRPLGFPVGNWSIPVVLQTQQTACSSRPEAFTCFPYTTFAQSPAASQFTFWWSVTSNATSAGEVNETLSISAGANTFSLTFPSTPLQLLDAGTPTEKYVFSVGVPKQVQPTVSLDGSASRDVCNYPSAILNGALYTRGNGTVAGQAPGVWPGTVWISHESSSGPSCEDASTRAPVAVAAGSESCDCGWVTGNGTVGG